jgi:signal transduction histidine kinase
VRPLASLRTRLLIVVAAAILPFVLYAALTAAREQSAAGSTLDSEALTMARAGSKRVDDGLSEIDHLIDSVVVRARQPGSANRGLGIRTDSLKSPYAALVSIAVLDSAGGRNGVFLGAPSRVDSMPVLRRISIWTTSNGQARNAKGGKAESFLDEGGVRGPEELVPLVIARPLMRPATPCNCLADSPGVIVAVVSAEQVRKFLVPDSLPSGGVAVLMNEAKAMLGRVGRYEYWLDRESTDTSMLRSNKKEGSFDFNGADRIRRVTAYSALKGLPWKVYVGLPRAITAAVPDQRLKDALMLALLSLGIAAIGVVLSVRSFTAPLQMLAADAKRLSAGVYSHRSLVADMGGELGNVGTALNTLAGDLESRRVALQDDLRRATQIFEESPVPMWVTDASVGGPGSGRIVQANAAAATLFGVPVGALIGQRDDELLDPSSAAQLLSPLSAVADTSAREMRRGTAMLRTAMGSSTEYQVTVSHVMQARFPARIVSVLDGAAPQRTLMLASGAITPLLSAGDAPAPVVNVLTAPETPAHDLRPAFAAQVANDFGEVFVALSGFSQLAMETAHDPDMHRVAVQRLYELTEHGIALTRQVRHYGENDAISLAAIDANDSLMHSLESMASRIGENIELTVRTDVAPATIVADAALVHHALDALIDNACDAMPMGGTLTLSSSSAVIDDTADSQAAVPAGSYIVLRVADTGVGISDAMQQRMFEPFVSTKRDQRTSAGLGLAAVAGIAKAHGWTIHVASQLNVGTTVSLYIPQPAEASGTPTSAPAVSEPTTRATPTAIIAVADAPPDTPLSATVISESLAMDSTNATSDVIATES